MYISLLTYLLKFPGFYPTRLATGPGFYPRFYGVSIIHTVSKPCRRIRTRLLLVLLLLPLVVVILMTSNADGDDH